MERNELVAVVIPFLAAWVHCCTPKSTYMAIVGMDIVSHDKKVELSFRGIGVGVNPGNGSADKLKKVCSFLKVEFDSDVCMWQSAFLPLDNSKYEDLTSQGSIGG